MFDSNLKNAVLAGVLASSAVYAGLYFFGSDGEGMKVDEANDKKSVFDNLGESFLFKFLLNGKPKLVKEDVVEKDVNIKLPGTGRKPHHL